MKILSYMVELENDTREDSECGVYYPRFLLLRSNKDMFHPRISVNR